MAIFKCDCGLITSTPADTTQCVRCHRVLGPRDRVVLRPSRERRDGAAGVPGCHIGLIHSDCPQGLGQLPAAGCP